MTTTALSHVRVFDGTTVTEDTTLVIEGPSIVRISGPVPDGATVIDGTGATVLPGLIDAHVHTSADSLRQALRFGVTTELEMMGHWSPEERHDVAENDGIADVRSAGLGISAPGGHPSELMGGPDKDEHEGEQQDGDNQHAAEAPHSAPHEFVMPSASTPEEAVAFVDRLVRSGSDYIKVMIEDGHVLNSPGLPMMTNETLLAAVSAAHRHGKTVIAHALTLQATQQALDAGVDGLAHLFLDRPHTPEIVQAIAAAGIFVTPCLTLNRSILGQTGEDLAADPRVASRLTPEWLDTLRSSFNTYPAGNFDDVLATVAALHDAGVDLLAGTDVSMPIRSLGGLAHGVSVHHEMQLLVQAGLTPIEAIRSATLTPAHRFGLHDRGDITEGARADLLLVDGDPTTDISTTLNIRQIWRRGVCQPE